VHLQYVTRHSDLHSATARTQPRPPSGTSYIFEWTEEKNKDDWRVWMATDGVSVVQWNGRDVWRPEKIISHTFIVTFWIMD